MRTVLQRKRAPDDDVKSVQRVPNFVATASTVEIPQIPETPIVVWGESAMSTTVNHGVINHWPLSSDKRCHNCAHFFEGVPVPLPVSRDDLRQVYFCEGKFCSWQCAKSFNMRETSPAGRGNRNMYIAVLAYKTWIKLKYVPIDEDTRQRMKTYCNYRIDPAPPRSTLVEFGGSVSIEEYRKHFCGVVPPTDIIAATSPCLTIRGMAVLPFIDTDSHGSSSPRALNKSVQQIEETGFFVGTKRIVTNREQEFNNSFVNRLKRAKVDPAIMRRKKQLDVSNTLLSTMGIKIKKRSK